MTDTPLDLDAIEARALAATPGPWSAADEHGLLGPTSSPAWCVSRMTDPTPARPDGWMYDIAYVEGDDREYNPDAEFIAHARADVPALVAALRKAEAQVAAVLALCDQADARLGQGNSLTPTAVRAAVDGAS